MRLSSVWWCKNNRMDQITVTDIWLAHLYLDSIYSKWIFMNHFCSLFFNTDGCAGVRFSPAHVASDLHWVSATFLLIVFPLCRRGVFNIPSFSIFPFVSLQVPLCSGTVVEIWGLNTLLCSSKDRQQFLSLSLSHALSDSRKMPSRTRKSWRVSASTFRGRRTIPQTSERSWLTTRSRSSRSRRRCTAKLFTHLTCVTAVFFLFTAAWL